jgi:K+-transporting ATPase KdpF subunit
MNTKILIGLVSAQPDAAGYSNQFSYLIGAIVAIFILGYLVYTLLHPEKF